MTTNTPVIYGLYNHSLRTAIAVVQSVAIALLLASCGGGASTETQPAAPGTTPTSSYTGPAPLTDDTQAFRIALWENIRIEERCGRCHSVTGGQSPMFARSDNVNEAYTAALPLVDNVTPALSRLVTKIGTSGAEPGHGCWDSTRQACVDTMTRWIENWLGGSGSGGRQIVLTAPVINPPGTSRNFPDTPANFGPIHDLLKLHCSECHSSSAEFPQSPFFASSDPDEAYEAARTKINLDQPGLSRLVVRLFPERHNCWFNTAIPTCQGDSDIMESLIDDFAQLIPLDEVDDTFVISSALRLDDGIVASGGDRFEDNLVALWEFKEPPGTNIANDTSGVGTAIDLELLGDADFIGGWGIRINDGGEARAITAADSSKLYDTINLTGEFAIEAWVAPANVTQEDAYIITYSGGDDIRNFTMGQTLYNYDFMVRNSNTDANGMPALSTDDDDEDLQATLQHVVMNFDPVDGRSIYVNGVHTGDFDAPVNQGGSVGNWANYFGLVLGNEASGNRQWTGTIRMVAIHNVTLTPEQITQNFDVGVGLKYFLLFYLGDVAGVNVREPYLMFEVSQFDGYSYLFNQPRFISLDPTEDPAKVNMAGIRIGINGRVTEVGQAFAKIDTRPAPYVWNYTPDGHFLSDRGTIIALEKGSSQDEFFLRFDVLGDEENVYLEPTVSPPATPPNGTPVPDYGLRTFEEISATMSALTTVSTQDSNVQFTYQRVKQQLPTAETMGGFLAAHQMAVAQLSIEYCNALVEDTGKRSSYWPGFDFSDDVVTAFGTSASPNTANRNLALNPLVDRILLPNPDPTAIPLNAALLTQPGLAEMKGELNSLVDELMNCRLDPDDPLTPRGTQYCATDRTETIMKAACAAAIGNAAMLVQ